MDGEKNYLCVNKLDLIILGLKSQLLEIDFYCLPDEDD
jgi:hypothetical protein